MAGATSARRRAASIRLVLLLAGCAGLAGGPAPLPAAPAARSETALAAAGEALRRDCLSPALPADGSEDAAARRNRLLSAYVFAIDVAHHEYEVSLWNSLGRSGRRAAQDFPRAIDGVAATLAGPRRPSEVREELRSRILDLVVRQMRANRAAAHAILVAKLQLPYSEWNSCASLIDVVSYIDSGSPGVALNALGALIASAARAGAAER